MKSVTVDYAAANVRAKDLARLVSDTLEGGECALPLALAHSVGRLAHEAASGGAASLCGVEWCNALLWQLAGSLPGKATPEGQDAILKAIAGVQEALGIAPEDRSWVADDDPEDPHYGAKEHAESALALVPMLRPLVDKHAEASIYGPRLDALATAIDEAINATSGTQYIERSKAAGTLADEVIEGWQDVGVPDSAVAWGLYRGILHSLEDGQTWIQTNRDTARRHQGTARRAERSGVAIHALPGEHGERGSIALHAAYELEQTASLLQCMEDMGEEPANRNRVQAHLFGRVKRLSRVVMSCLDDDDTLDGLRERMED